MAAVVGDEHAPAEDMIFGLVLSVQPSKGRKPVQDEGKINLRKLLIALTIGYCVRS